MPKKTNRLQGFIPKQAKKVFQGRVFSIYQWRQKLFDGRVAIYERAKRPDACVVFACAKGKILLERQRQPDTGWFYSLAGGMVDKNESSIQAAKRELLEETGYASKEWQKLMRISADFRVDSSLYVFIAKNCKKISSPKIESGEKISLTAVSLEKLLDLAERPDFRHYALLPFLYKLKLHPKELKKFKNLLFS